MPKSRELNLITDRGQPNTAGEVALLILAGKQLLHLRAAAAAAVVAEKQAGNPSAAVLNLEEQLMLEDGAADLLAAARAFERGDDAVQALLFPREHADGTRKT